MEFNREKILQHAQQADVPQPFLTELACYCDFVAKNEWVENEWKQYYARLFECEEPIFPIRLVADIPLPKESEQAYPGFFSTTIFLAAAAYFESFLRTTGLQNTKYDFLDTYYKNIRRFMEMNFVRDHTYALLRHGYFLYGYARPFILRIGRLAYELRRYSTRLYRICENSAGEHLFVKSGEAIPNGYWEVIREGEPYVTIHIPGEGKLLPNEVQESLQDAAVILRKVFQKYEIKYFLCDSWLLSPQIRAFLKESSNIRKFQDLFDLAPGESERNALYEHIFRVPPCPIENLVPQNDFQRSVLSIYKQGGELCNGIGILKKQLII